MSRVTRSVEATSAHEAAAVAGERRTIANGVWGMVLFVVTEATLFGTLIGTYFYLRFRTEVWPPEGIAPPAAELPITLTVVLAISTLPVLLAVRAVRRGLRGVAIAQVAATTLVAGGYLAWQIVLYIEDLSKFAPDETAYGSIYFLLLGVHHAHVAVGLALNLWVIARLIPGLTNYRVITVQAVAVYWVFVALIAIPVVATQVSPA